MNQLITRTVVNMSLEQLLVAAQLEDIARIGWDNHLQLQGYISISTSGLEVKRFNFMMDEARQIVEFPGEARTLLIMRLTKELTEGRVTRMDKLDLELIRQMCKQFNVHLTEIDEGGYTMFDMNGVVQLSEPNEDTQGKWVVYKVTVKPGVHTLRNGDPGYPDEVDVDEVSSHDTCLQGVIEAVKLAVEISAGDINADLGMFGSPEEQMEGVL